MKNYHYNSKTMIRAIVLMQVRNWQYLEPISGSYLLYCKNIYFLNLENKLDITFCNEKLRNLTSILIFGIFHRSILYIFYFFHHDTSKKVLFLSVILGCMVMVDGCHTDKVYLQPIKEIKFLDDWTEKFIPANVTGIIMT